MDTLVQEDFDMQLTAVTNTGFTLTLTMATVANIKIMEIGYVTVDPSFLYHLNVFKNVPIDFGSTLSTVNTNNGRPRSYTNTIDYPTLAAGRAYTTLGATLTSNKVCLFLSGIRHLSTEIVNFRVTSLVTSTTTFDISVTVAAGATIGMLKFSMAVVDLATMSSVPNYKFIHEEWTVNTVTGNFIPIPNTLIPSSLLGVLDFTASSATCGLALNFDIDFPNSQYSVTASVLDASSTALCTVASAHYTLVHMRQWTCSASYPYYNSTTSLCQNGCGDFLYLSGSSCLPCQFDCLSCYGNGFYQCNTCDPTRYLYFSGYCRCNTGYYESFMNACTPCTSSIPGCNACSTSATAFGQVGTITCTSCNAYSVARFGNCETCASHIPSCYSCFLSPYPTVYCTAAYLASERVAVSGNVYPCTDYISNCKRCSDRWNCVLCDVDNFYALNGGGGCILCNTAANMFPGPTNYCQLCASSNCLTCSSYSTCSSCIAPYGVNTTTSLCVMCDSLAASVYRDPVTTICSYCPANCILCSSGANTCNICAPGYIFGYNNCVPCRSLNCATCDYLGKCLTCQTTLIQPFINSQGNCLSCDIVGCLICHDDALKCYICNTALGYTRLPNGICDKCAVSCNCTGYYLSPTNQSCLTVCGDGWLRMAEQCDDGNLVNGDGCSSVCTIEPQWNCVPYGTQSCCSLKSDIGFGVDYIFKDPNSNLVDFTVSFIQDNSLIVGLDYQNPSSMIVSMDWKIKVLSVTTKTGRSFKVKAEILQDIQDQWIDMMIQIVNPVANCSLAYEKTISFFVNPNNNLPAIWYDSKTLKSLEQTKSTYKAMEAASFMVLGVSLISGKIVGLELFGSLQLAYFTLTENKGVHMILSPLMNMSNLNGYNRILQSVANLPPSINTIGYSAQFLRNCNGMLMLMGAQIGLSIILFFMSYYLKSVSNKCARIARRMYKQILLTLILFNCFNIAFSSGLHFIYADPTDPIYLWSTVTAIAAVTIPILMSIALLCVDVNGFGEFKNQLKSDMACQSYFTLTILYRMGLGFYMSIMNESETASLITVGLTLSFVMFNLVNLPFVEAYHNYRANICHFTQLVVLMVGNYYRMVSAIKGAAVTYRIFWPAYLQVVCLFVCIAMSIVCLVYQLYLMIRKCCGAKQPRTAGIGLKYKVKNSSSSDGNAVNETESDFIHQAQQNRPKQVFVDFDVTDLD